MEKSGVEISFFLAWQILKRNLKQWGEIILVLLEPVETISSFIRALSGAAPEQIKLASAGTPAVSTTFGFIQSKQETGDEMRDPDLI